jgi:hypothetical protein
MFTEANKQTLVISYSTTWQRLWVKEFVGKDIDGQAFIREKGFTIDPFLRGECRLTSPKNVLAYLCGSRAEYATPSQ